MNYWLKISLSAAAVAGIGGVYYWDETQTKKDAETQASSVKALAFESKDARRMELSLPSGKYVFERSDGTTDWKMLEPKPGVRPDQDTVNNVLAALQTLKLERELPGTEKSLTGPGAADYGLDKPRIDVRVGLASGRTLQLQIGNDVSIGTTTGENFAAVSVYGRTPERSNLLILESSIVSTLKKDFGDFRTKVAGDFKVGDVQAFTIAKSGQPNMELVKADRTWKITAPRELPADSNNAALFLDRLSKLRVVKVAEADNVTPATRAQSGLEQPTQVVEVKDAKGGVLQRLEFGLTPSQAFVSMPGGAIGHFGVNDWADVAPELNFFRDRRVMREFAMGDVTRIRTESGNVYQKEGQDWYAVGGQAAAAPSASVTPAVPGTPKPPATRAAGDLFSDWEFMTADAIIEGEEAADLSKYGLATPVTSFTFEGGSENKQSERILVGSRVPKNEKSVYVKRASRPEIFVVEAAWLDKLSELSGSGKEPQAKK